MDEEHCIQINSSKLLQKHEVNWGFVILKRVNKKNSLKLLVSLSRRPEIEPMRTLVVDLYLHEEEEAYNKLCLKQLFTIKQDYVGRVGKK